jgi:hypothetical protein
MASTYVNDLRLNEMATGDASGSWGTVTNTNLELIGEAFSYGTETIGDADSTLTIADGAADAARSFYLKITSSVDLTTTRIVTLGPNTVSKVWMIENATTGSQVITIKQGSGATINVPNGQVKMISTDGAGSGGAVLDLLVDVDLTGTTTLVNLDVSGAVDIAGDLTLSAGGDGALRFTAASSVKVLDNDAAALVFEEADNAYMTFVTTDGSEAVKFDKALDINAATQIDATVTVGVDDTGYDVKFFGATAGAYMLWDESADDLILGGAAGLSVNSTALVTGVLTTTAATVSNGGGQFNGAINVGVDGTGYDVKFFGDTSGAYMQWDQSADDLILGVGSELVIGTTASAQLLGSGIYIDSSGYTAITLKKGASNTGHAIDFNDESNALQFRIATNVGSGGENLLFCSGATPALKLDTAGDFSVLNGSDFFTVTLGTNNFRAGVNAGNSIASGGNYNVLVGDEAGTAITTGDHNVAIGFSALDAEDGGTASVAIGSYALSNQNADGNNYNTAVGYVAGSDITSGVQNTLIGAAAGDALTDADNNVALGYASLSAETNNNGNTAIGAEALMSQNVGGGGDARNTAVGFAAGTSVTSGIKNTLIGGRSGDALINADSNVAVGESALGSDTYGSGSVAIGDSALYSQNFTSAATSFNTAVGYAAGNSTTTGQSNVFVGYNSGQFNSTGYENTFVGSGAGTGVTGARITGSSNTAVGQGAGNDLQGAVSDNTFLGANAGGQVTTGAYNTFLGSGAGLKVATGGTNICIGGAAGGEITTGQNNIMMGYIAGRHGVNLVDGDNNLLLGSYTDTTATDTDNANVIGYNVTGEGGFTTLGVNADDIRAAHGTATWTTVSDERYKKDIVDSTAGLSFINALQPRTFKYKNLGELPETFRAYKADSTDVFKNSDTNHGFIAQEVKTAIDADSGIKDGFKLWAERDDGSQEVGEAALIPILTKAVQELSTALDAALARIAVLEG